MTKIYFHHAAIVSFGKVSTTQKKEAEDLGVCCYSWEEFALLVIYLFLKKKTCLLEQHKK